jgi:nitrate reductase assembly molybdenum cofactor insertion protein NarJ
MNETETARTDIALAAEWRLIGLVLERPRPRWHDEVAHLSREVHDRALREAATAAEDATEGEYLRLFGPGGMVSPREVTYQPFADPGHLLAQLATAYEAFAFRPHVEEPIDHVAVEVAFVSYLLLKETFARARNDADAAAITAGARHRFMETHLAAFASTLAERLESAGPSYLLPVARMLTARLPAGLAPRRPSAAVVDTCNACGRVDVS